MLLWGIAFELAFTAAVIYVPWLQDVFGTAALTPAQLVVILPFPFAVWGRRRTRPPAQAAFGPPSDSAHRCLGGQDRVMTQIPHGSA